MDARYYFDGEHILQRVFVLYGNTNDLYVTLTKHWHSVGPLLESHLKALGYQVVLFYNGGKTLRCYDVDHAKNRRKFFPTKAEKRIDERNSVRGADGAEPAEVRAQSEADDDKSGKLRPRIRRKGEEDSNETKSAAAPAQNGPSGSGTVRMQPRVRRREAPPPKSAAPEAEGERVDLEFDYPEDQIPSYLNEIMVSTAPVRSAVIFGNAGNLIKPSDTNTKIAEYVSSWYGLRGNNKNIAVLLFQERQLEALPDMLRSDSTWRFLYENVFAEREHNDSLIRIGAPREDELFYLLNLYNLFSHEGGDRSEILAAAHRMVLRNDHRLTALKSFFERHPGEEIDALLREYGSANEEDALEHIRNTEGWEEVAQVVGRLVDSALRGHRVERRSEPYCDSERNLRMAYEMEGSHYDMNLSMVLEGNPGTGKTTAAYWIGEALRQNGLLPSGHMVKVTRTDLVAGYVGHTALKTRAKIEEARGGILFVDEAYSLYRKGSGGESNDFGIEAIETILEAMTSMRGEICVIFAGYPREMNELLLKSNSGLLRRFDGNIINIPDYQPALLERIALRRIVARNRENAASGYGLRFLIDASLACQEAEEGTPAIAPEELVERARADRDNHRPLCPLSVFFDNWYADRDVNVFGNAGAAVELAEMLMANALRRSNAYAREIAIGRGDFARGMENMFICRKPTIAEVEKQLADVVGMESVKESLRRVTSYLQLVKAQRDTAHSLRSEWEELVPMEAGNYLFVGNPGVGKTMIAEKLALTLSSLGVIRRYKPIRVTGMDLIGRLQHEGVDGLKKYIDECSGSVLVIDEAHQLAISAMGQAVIKALLDPIIEKSSEMSFVFCCYPEERQRLLDCDQGLARRISDVFVFKDYTPDEVLQIFQLMVNKAGYRLDSEAVAVAREKLALLYGVGGMWENGATAEKLFKESRVSLAMRMLGGMEAGAVSKAVTEGEMGETELYRISAEDVESGFARMRSNLMLKNSGREMPG